MLNAGDLEAVNGCAEIPITARVSVIIPTKNRRTDLLIAVRSLVRQTVLPSQIVVVDQSRDDGALRDLQTELADVECAKLDYLYDPLLKGAAAARNRAMDLAAGDIWLFLDDDVVLEPDFIEQQIAVYRAYPEVGGVSGVITNYPLPSVWSRAWIALFMRGPFRDRRQPIYWHSDRLRHSPPIIVPWFTGCLMSFRAELVRGRRFDENLRGVSDGEDADFCIQLGPATRLVIAPSARLEHRHSPAGRLRDHWLRRNVRGNFFLYQKNWNDRAFNHICYWWLWTGYFSVALFASLRRGSLDPWRALRTGAAEASQIFRRRQSARAN